jgi:hypothetical protein
MRIAAPEVFPEVRASGKKSPRLEGNYFGPVYPEAPKFQDPQTDLHDIGVSMISSLKRTRVSYTGKSWKETIDPVR